MNRRKSSSAVMSRNVDKVAHVSGRLERVDHVHNSMELVEMARQRKLSWSAAVGSIDSRSVDTGLNELHRITGII